MATPSILGGKVNSVNVPKAPQWPHLDDEQKNDLKRNIKRIMSEQNAVLVAHYYTDGDLQDLAEETGGCVSDSLEMARFGKEHDASTLIVAGVRFMGETAKILSPEKRILVPDLSATCSLDEGCPHSEFTEFCQAHPEHTVVVYANTSAAVKANADWMVTSSIALPIVEHLKTQGKKILWAPDKHLGHYIQRITGAEMTMWNGSCVVHEEFKSVALQRVRKLHPQAAVLVHPESPAEVVAQADVVGSTTQLIDSVTSMSNQEFIVATDDGIFHKMQNSAPQKQLILAPTSGAGATCESCGHCPWMAMNSLQSLEATLLSGENEILLDPELGKRAFVPIQRMLDFAAQRSNQG